MELYSIISIVISLAALFAYSVAKFTSLPTTIGIMILTMVFSLLLVLASHVFDISALHKTMEAVSALNFRDLLLNRMLGFLLFAGAIHVNSNELKKQRLPIIALASVGTVLSTLLVGFFTYYLFVLFNHPVAFIYCLLFGSLISPTDPIAVLGILKQAKIPASLEMKITGESLFNDGIALVIFTLLYEVASSGSANPSVSEIGLFFLHEAGGGLVLGAVLGYVGFLFTKSIDNYQVEVLITVAIVMGGYELANTLHVSGALAMVVAGIITGNKVKHEAMSDKTQDYVGKFWELVDEILNAVLFILIGIEMLVIQITSGIFWLGLIAIVIVLVSRFLSVGVSVLVFKKMADLEKNSAQILTWGGLRGGISVAMALSLASSMHRNEFLPMTYIIVVFSIFVQGLTIGKVAKKLSA